jgi:serine-type D-Ala-D-Ala carboxypeptidase/endopeptidase
MIVRTVLRRCQAVTTVLLSLLAGIATAQTVASPPAELDAAAVRAALIPRVNDGTFRGIATAWRVGDSLRTASAGVVAAGGAAIDPSTSFELGEINAVLTAALLANMVSKGELSLDDLVQRFLPPGIRLPTRAGRAMTLGDLAFQRSGLPGRVRAGAGRSSIEQLGEAVRAARLTADIGSRYAFSSLGTELLGLALERHLGVSLEAAIQTRILSPIDVEGLSTTPADRLAPAQVAIGHSARGSPVSSENRHRSVWRASIFGLSRFAVAAADTVRGPLARTFALMMRTRSVGPESSLPVALGWRVLRLQGRDIYWHDAQDAAGFSAFVAVDPSKGHASAVLSNSARAVDAIAGQLLLGAVPVITSTPRATQAAQVARVISRPRAAAPRRKSGARRSRTARPSTRRARR